MASHFQCTVQRGYTMERSPVFPFCRAGLLEKRCFVNLNFTKKIVQFKLISLILSVWRHRAQCGFPWYCSCPLLWFCRKCVTPVFMDLYWVFIYINTFEWNWTNNRLGSVQKLNKSVFCNVMVKRSTESDLQNLYLQCVSSSVNRGQTDGPLIDKCN